MRNLLRQGFIIVIWAVVLLQLTRTALFVADNPVPFDADEANHASRALSVYEAFGERNGIWHALRDQAFYPPLYSLIGACSYFVSGGPGITASRLGSVAPLLAGLVILWLAAAKACFKFQKAEPEVSQTCSLFAVLLAASSPLILANSVLSMPEALGFCLSTLLLLLTVEADAQGQVTTRRCIALAIVAGLLGLTKYAYAFFCVPALATALLLWRPEGRWNLRPLTVFLCSFALIVLCWCLTSYPGSIWYYLFGHEERSFIISARKLLFHPKAFLEHFTLHWAIGAGAVLLCLVAFGRSFRRISVIFAVVGALSPYMVLGMSDEQGARHLIPSSTFVWYLAALGLCELGRRVPQRARLAALAAPVLLLAVYYPASTPALMRFVREKLETNQEIEGITLDMLRGLKCQSPILMLGRGDGFSAQWVRWRIAVECKQKLNSVIVDPYPFSDTIYQKSLRTRAPFAKAYSDPSFPRSPLETVLATGYYRGLIAFKARGQKGEFTRLDFAAVREKYPATVSTHGAWKLTIISIPPAH